MKVYAFLLSMPNYDRALQSSLVISRESDFLNGDCGMALKCQLSAERAAAFRMRNGTVFVVRKSKIFLHVGRVTFEQGLRSGEQETICSTYLNPREKLSLRNGKTNREAATDQPPTDRDRPRKFNYAAGRKIKTSEERTDSHSLSSRDARTTEWRLLQCLSALRQSSAPPMTVSSVPASQLIIHMG